MRGRMRGEEREERKRKRKERRQENHTHHYRQPIPLHHGDQNLVTGGQLPKHDNHQGETLMGAAS